LAAAPSTSVEPATRNPLRTAAATVDRYALPSESTPAAQVASAYAAANTPSSVASNSVQVDRYALPTLPANDSQETGVNDPIASPSRGPAKAAFADSPAPSPSQRATVTNAIDVAPVTSATVQLSTPAGKYRPGGTSDYSSADSSPHIEVATRPEAAQSTSAATSDPWSPPAVSTPTGSGGIGTY
jgi:hypothetical protein